MTKSFLLNTKSTSERYSLGLDTFVTFSFGEGSKEVNCILPLQAFVTPGADRLTGASVTENEVLVAIDSPGLKEQVLIVSKIVILCTRTGRRRTNTDSSGRVYHKQSPETR
jgi:hypothetical protein